MSPGQKRNIQESNGEERGGMDRERGSGGMDQEGE